MTHDPVSNAYINSPTCSSRPVHHWQVFISRRAALSTPLVIALYNLLLMSFRGGTEVTSRTDDIKDFKNNPVQFIDPGQCVVATVSIYS